MTEPYITFQPIFGDQWENLPSVMHKHYANRAYTDDVVVMEGIMDIESSFVAKLFSPVFLLLGTLVPHEGKDVPVTVTARSHTDTAQYIFDREFRFPGRKPCRFKSAMESIDGNDVVEFMRFGIGWRMNYLWQDGKVILKHKGYVWRLFGKLIRIPAGLLLGTGYAEEEPTSEDTFKMRMYIQHPLWGKVYEYRGTFRVLDR